MDAHIDEFGCGICPQPSITRYRRVVGAAGAAELELLTEDELLVFLHPGGNGTP